MIVPKLMVACLSSIVLSFSLPVFMPVFEDFTYFQNVFMYVFYASPIIFTYGIMTSIFSEFLSQRMTFKIKKITSFLMHLMFGAFFVFPYGLIFDLSVFTEGTINFATVMGVFSAFIFFVINEFILLYVKMKNRS